MPTTTANISVDIPKSYNVDALQKKLTAYALHLIRMDKSYKERKTLHARSSERSHTAGIC